MLQNPGRWLLFTFALIALSIFLVFTKGISLGADLKGGTRLVYGVPVEDAIRADIIKNRAEAADLVRRTIDVMNKRVDGLGLREINLVGQGDDQIVVELPGLSESEIANIKDTITSLGRLEWRIVADASDPFDLGRERKKLDDYLARPDVKQRVEQWEKEEAARPITARRELTFWVDVLRGFHSLSGEGAPVRGLRWYVRDEPKSAQWANADARKGQPRFEPLRIEDQLDLKDGARYVFRGEDLQRVGIQRDDKGGLAVFFELRGDKRSAFGELTGKNVGRALAIVLNDLLYTDPRINSELPGSGIIISNQAGGYQLAEAQSLVTVLETGSLPVRPRLESESRIGASLGEDSIKLGMWSSLLSLAATVGFMLLYYRLAGVVAALSLVVNGAVLLGVLSLYGATLTLPGIGGFILSLAMAVDSNILIYERIREERDRGRGVEQAVRLGFDRAFVTIVDSNLTTLLTSVVLLAIGTGPIKGLGLTLSVGILTTLFAALVFTKATFAWLLERKLLPEVKMLRLFKKTPDLRFIRIWKVTVAVSVLTSVAGLVAFFTSPDSVYGIDFVGGATARIRLREPVAVAEMRQLLANMPGFESPDVLPSLSEGSVVAGKPGYREFVVKGKLDREKREMIKADPTGKQQEIVNSFRDGIRDVLKNKLVPDPVTDVRIEGGTEGSQRKVAFTLHFEGAADPATVKQLLERELPTLTDLKIAEGGQSQEEAVTANLATGVTEAELRTRVPAAFDKVRDQIRVSEPFPEVNTILPRVAKSLKNKAILSLLVSFGAIILYIRFRFQEYRYGIGGVIGIIHDLVVTLGIVAIANRLGLVDVEIDMTMVAVFLTIAGYSINDTIVIYDRIRENLAMPEHERGDLAQIIDESCNQTLSRTLLTATAAFFSSFLMFVINRNKHNPLEGFGFTMMVGIASGTYSSIWVASLFVVAVERWKQRGKPGKAGPALASGNAAQKAPSIAASKA